MLDWIRGLFRSAVYIRVFRDRMVLVDLLSGREIAESPPNPYSTDRLLVGAYSIAESTMRRGLKHLYADKRFAAAPKVLIQPMDFADGAISEVEETVLKELAQAAGARSITVWVGEPLTRERARQMLAGQEGI